MNSYSRKNSFSNLRQLRNKKKPNFVELDIHIDKLKKYNPNLKLQTTE